MQQTFSFIQNTLMFQLINFELHECSLVYRISFEEIIGNRVFQHIEIPLTLHGQEDL